MATAASADCVWLKNGGIARGKIFEIQVKIGPLTQTLARAKVKNLQIENGKVTITDIDGVKYTGKIGLVILDAEDGRMSLEGRTIKSLEITPAEAPKAAVQWQASSEKPEPDKEAATPADKLRNEYLKKLKDAENQELKALRELYEAKNSELEKLASGLREECVRLGADPDKPAPAPSAEAWKALQDLHKAQEILKDFTKDIQAKKNEITRRAAIARERINSYHAAIVKEKQELSEPAMRKIFERAFTKIEE